MCSRSITYKIYLFWFLSCFLWFWYFIFDKEKNIFGFSVSFWFPKFVAFDLSNGTFDFRNLSRLISQMTLLISKSCLLWFLKWHFWFPKFVSFDFSNDTFDFQNLSRLISQMAFLISKMRLIWILSTWQFLWVVRPTQGRGDTQSVVTTRPNEAAKVFWWKMGMCRRIGFGFPKGGFVLSVLNRDIYLWRQQSNHIFTGRDKPFGEKGKYLCYP